MDPLSQHTCTICNKTFKKSGHLILHSRMHDSTQTLHLPGAHKCDLCQKTFAKPYSLKLHREKTHLKSMNGRHVCEYCGKRFVFKSQLQTHSKTHGPKKERYNANEEEKNNDNEKEKDNNDEKEKNDNDGNEKNRDDENEDELPCFNVSLVTELPKRKVNSSFIQRPHKCSLCEKTFDKPRWLKLHHETVHLRSINGKHACDLCGKRFLFKSALLKHSKAHGPKEEKN